MSIALPRRAAVFGVAALGAGLSVASVARASDEQDIIDGCSITLDHLRGDAAFGNAKQILATAAGVLIIPHIVKAGFIFGGEGGNGVLMQHHGRIWSQPAFFAMGSASFGLQAGVEVEEMVVILRTQAALSAVLSGHYKVGATASVTLATLGSSASVASSGQLADIIVWASASGAFAGVNIDGSIIAAKPDWNRTYYGPSATLQGILGNRYRSRGTAALRSAMESVA
jgi:SH3 domain-containing YSC84-like protein 1